MLDRPDAAELLEAIGAFLSEDIVPACEGRKRFHALVAANVAQVLAREARFGPEHLETEIAALWELLDRSGTAPESGERHQLARSLSTELCARIDRGDADVSPWRPRVFAFLKASIGRRLDIDNPKFRR